MRSRVHRGARRSHVGEVLHPSEGALGEASVSKHDEDSDDRLLDKAGGVVGRSGAICRAWFTNSKGRQQRCTRKKGHWGKHK